MTSVNEPLRFLSVCSGIEAASVAWSPLGWEAVAFSEIEKFPSAVLAHHYPEVPNLGDFTKIDTTKLGRVDVLSGGTPCQAFSVAGMRNSLADARGNLTLSFVRLAHELAGIAEAPLGSEPGVTAGGERQSGNGLRNVVWENVPGVLSTKDNAFGCFLGALVGADGALPPPSGKRWPDAGMVDGPKGRAAWRVLDAQYFGLAQRRRRVILVADFGNGADPAAVLFEFESVLGNPPPSRETWETTTHPIAPSLVSSGRGVERTGDTRGQDPVVDGDNGVAYAPEIARCDATREGSSQDYETTTMVAQPIVYSIMPQNSGKDYKAREVDVAQPLMAAGLVGGNQGGDFILEPVCVTGSVTHTLKADGFDASEDGTGRGQPIVNAYRTAGDGAVYDEGRDDVAPLTTATDPNANIIAFDTTQMTSKTNRSNPRAGDPCHPLSSQAHPPAIAFSSKDFGADAAEELSPTIRASGHTNSHANAGAPPAVALAFDTYNQSVSDVTHTLRNPNGTFGDALPAVLTTAVRRLTPVECERLMGFPDNYTRIPWRKKPAEDCPDGPRYKSLGNSWAVPKFVWLGKRIAANMPRSAA